MVGRSGSEEEAGEGEGEEGQERGRHPGSERLVAALARRPRTRLSVEAVKPPLGEAPTPLADRVRIGTNPLGNRLVLKTIRRRQHDTRPPRQTLRRLATPRQAF